MSILALLRVVSSAKGKLEEKNPNQFFHIDRNSETFNKDIRIDELTRDKVRLESEVEKLTRELIKAGLAIDKTKLATNS